MRNNIYYWKCDNPLAESEKRLMNEKYNLSDISPIVEEIVSSLFGQRPYKIVPIKYSGNHYTYSFKIDEKNYVFRSDDSRLVDDYLLAEEAAIKTVATFGVAVPNVIITSTDTEKYPIRFQIMEKVPGKTLQTYYSAQNLRSEQIFKKLGKTLSRIHSQSFNGFGFIDTEELKKSSTIQGLCSSHEEYFYTRLDDHIKYIYDKDFISKAERLDIEMLMKKAEPHLKLEEGTLTHKDLSLWNLVGTKEKVNAVLDWDDCIIGDPIDDLSILYCFYNRDLVNVASKAYYKGKEKPEDYEQRLGIYYLRNMIWKSYLRIMMDYFDIPTRVKLLTTDRSDSLYDFTRNKITEGIETLKPLL